MPRPRLETTLAQSREALLEQVEWPRMSRLGRSDLGPDLRFYMGEDVCRGTRLGHMTLFVRGVQSKNDIGREVHRRRLNGKRITHVYLGAQGTFEEEECISFFDLAHALLVIGYLVTLEIPYEYAKRHAVQEIPADLLASDRFSLVVRLHWPRVRELGVNATMLLSDNFLGSNGGVWTMPIADLTKDEAHTPWRWFHADVPFTDQPMP